MRSQSLHATWRACTPGGNKVLPSARRGHRRLPLQSCSHHPAEGACSDAGLRTRYGALPGQRCSPTEPTSSRAAQEQQTAPVLRWLAREALCSPAGSSANIPRLDPLPALRTGPAVPRKGAPCSPCCRRVTCLRGRTPLGRELLPRSCLDRTCLPPPDSSSAPALGVSYANNSAAQTQEHLHLVGRATARLHQDYVHVRAPTTPPVTPTQTGLVWLLLHSASFSHSYLPYLHRFHGNKDSLKAKSVDLSHSKVTCFLFNIKTNYSRKKSKTESVGSERGAHQTPSPENASSPRRQAASQWALCSLLHLCSLWGCSLTGHRFALVDSGDLDPKPISKNHQLKHSFKVYYV